jgi:hypothetical protein
MPRKETRRKRLERQKERGEAREAGVPVRETEVAQRNVEDGVSYSGAFGGLLATGLFLTLTIRILVDPGGDSRLWAIPFTAASVFFLPSVYASLVPGYPKRERVLRWATLGSIVIALAGSVAVGTLSLAVLLAPSTGLLAVGAGFIFQPSPKKK